MNNSPSSRYLHSSSSLPNNPNDVILFGGYSNNVVSNDVWIFSTLNEQWKIISLDNNQSSYGSRSVFNDNNMINRRAGASILVFGTYLFIFGSEAMINNDAWLIGTESCGGLSELSFSVCSNRGRCLVSDTCTCMNSAHDTTTNCSSCLDYTKDYNAFCLDFSCFGYPRTHPYTCHSHGKCLQPDVCECEFGKLRYTGLDCGNWNCWGFHRYDPLSCSGHGSCYSHNQCYCWSGWTGNDCSIPFICIR